MLACSLDVLSLISVALLTNSFLRLCKNKNLALKRSQTTEFVNNLRANLDHLWREAGPHGTPTLTRTFNAFNQFSQNTQRMTFIWSWGERRLNQTFAFLSKFVMERTKCISHGVCSARTLVHFSCACRLQLMQVNAWSLAHMGNNNT